MEHFIEAALELLFGLFKSEHKEQPDVDLKNEFKVYYNKTASVIFLSILFLGCALFLAASFFVGSDTKILFYIFSAPLFICFGLNLFLFSIKYDVNNEKIAKTTLLFFKKQILWDEICCVRIIEKDDDSNVIIALYNNDKKCVLDFLSEMENVWHIVKMAEFKNIEIRNEKNLSIKQIRRL